MVESVYDWETVLDVSVNLVPLGIILFFMFLFLAQDPFGRAPFTMFLTQGLLVVPFVSLALLTYVAGRVIKRDEESLEE